MQQRVDLQELILSNACKHNKGHTLLWLAGHWMFLILSGHVVRKLDVSSLYCSPIQSKPEDWSTDNVTPPSSLLVYNILQFCLDQSADESHTSSVCPTERLSGCLKKVGERTTPLRLREKFDCFTWWRKTSIDEGRGHRGLCNDCLITKTEVRMSQRTRMRLETKSWFIACSDNNFQGRSGVFNLSVRVEQRFKQDGALNSDLKPWILPIINYMINGY